MAVTEELLILYFSLGLSPFLREKLKERLMEDEDSRRN